MTIHGFAYEGCWMSSSKSCSRRLRRVDDLIGRRSPSSCGLHLVFQGGCVADGLATSLFLGGSVFYPWLHIGSDQQTLGLWCWAVVWWWMSAVRIKGVPSVASCCRREVGFMSIDDLHAEVILDGWTLPCSVVACQAEMAGWRIVDWRRWTWGQ